MNSLKKKLSFLTFMHACNRSKMQEFGNENIIVYNKPRREYLKEQFAIRTAEIDDLWDQGLIKESLNKTIELLDFLDYHGAIDLRLNYCGPKSSQI